MSRGSDSTRQTRVATRRRLKAQAECLHRVEFFGRPYGYVCNACGSFRRSEDSAWTLLPGLDELQRAAQSIGAATLERMYDQAEKAVDAAFQRLAEADARLSLIAELLEEQLDFEPDSDDEGEKERDEVHEDPAFCAVDPEVLRRAEMFILGKLRRSADTAAEVVIDLDNLLHVHGLDVTMNERIRAADPRVKFRDQGDWQQLVP